MRLPRMSVRLHDPTFRLPATPVLRLPYLPTIRVFPRRGVAEWVLIASIIAYLSICAAVYFSYVQSWIEGDSIIRIGADSDRYWAAAKTIGDVDGERLVSLTGNFLGPVAIAYLFHDGILVMAFNVLLFGLALKIAASIPNLHKVQFASLMLLNAELLPTLTTLNKEILALFASVLAAKYFMSERPTKVLLFWMFLFAFLARWEQAFVLGLFFLQRPYFRRRPNVPVWLLIAAVTVAYPLAFKLLGVSSSLFDALLANGGLIKTLNQIQENFGFPLVLAPKLLMNLAGRLASPGDYLNGAFLADGFDDPQQQIFQPLGCLAYLLVFGWAVWKGRLRMDSPLILLASLTLVITAATPFIQPRYVYGPYTLVCLELCLPLVKRIDGDVHSTPLQAARP
jgi:hypothetical protein